MRKLIILIIIVALIVATNSNKKLYTILSKTEYVEIYTNSLELQNQNNSNPCGYGYCMIVDGRIAEDTIKSLEDVSAIQFNYQGEYLDLLNALNAEVIYINELQGITFIVAYTSFITPFILVDGDRVNIHIAIKDSGEKIIGIPVIYGDI